MSSHPESSVKDHLFIDQKERGPLRADVLKAAFGFPRLFNRPLYRSYEQMVVNCSSDFLVTRSKSHLRKILCYQFFLQKRIESAIQAGSEKEIFLKLFKGPSRICIALVFSSSYAFQKEQLIKSLDAFLPGVSKISKSFYMWHSADFPYFYTYFEIDKLRGKELSTRHLAWIEKHLKRQMLATSPLTPAIFWPYNKEESHRQIQLLVNEMTHEQDIPHLSIHFQEQTSSSLEFLIHLVRPKSEALELEKLPRSLTFFRYSHHVINTPFTIEIDVFSIKMHSQIFDVKDSINLLYARRYLVKYLEILVGTFRDYNGGLFEKQQDQFEEVRLALGSKIPYFDLFAERLFYALHPFEKWLSLSIHEIESLFRVFSDLICERKSEMTQSTDSKLFTVVKRVAGTNFHPCNQTYKKFAAYAQLTIGTFHYECFCNQSIEEMQIPQFYPSNDDNTLKLIFEEGSPPSLNPHFSSSDMRSRLINKLLFEGLTRLNGDQKPELAGAKSYEISPDAKTYTFYLKKGAWSNGEKITAIDYVESWAWALQDFVSHPELLFLIKNAKNYREKKCGLDEVGIKAINPETLKIELENPDPNFLVKLSQPFFFPMFGNRKEPKWFNGPYLIQERKKQLIKLDRNPYFWKNQDEGFQHIEVSFIGSNDEIYQRFKNGKLDWIGDPLTILSKTQVAELEKANLLKKKPVPRRFSIHFNTNHPILKSKSIRCALSICIDRDHIVNEIFPYSISIKPHEKSDALALAHFEEGLRELNINRNSFPNLTLSYSDQTRRDELAHYLQSSWFQALGVRVELKKHTWNHFRSHLEKGNFEICGTIQDTLNENSSEYLERFEGENSWNFSCWSHLVYRQLIQTAKEEKDPSKQLLLIHQAKQILIENLPFTPLFDYTHLYAVSPRFECSFFDEEGCIDFSQGKKL